MDPEYFNELSKRRDSLRLKAFGYGILTGVSSLCLRSPFLVTSRMANLNLHIYLGRYLITGGTTVFFGYNSLQNFCKSTTTSRRIRIEIDGSGPMKYISWCDDER